MNKNLDVIWTNQFKKDLKLAKKQGKDTETLFEVIEKLANGEPLAEKYRDHFPVEDHAEHSGAGVLYHPAQ